MTMLLDTITDREFFDRYSDIESEQYFLLKYLADCPNGEATEQELNEALIVHALCRTVVDGYVLVEWDDKGSALYRKNPDVEFPDFDA